MTKKILIAWQGYNEETHGTVVDNNDMIVVYCETKPIWAEIYNQNDLIEFAQIYLNKRNSNPRMTNKEILKYWQENFKNKKCNHENMQMKSSGIWKCKCGYSHF